jgi:hypothetical protein
VVRIDLRCCHGFHVYHILTFYSIKKKAKDLGQVFRNLPAAEMARLLHLGTIAGAVFVQTGNSDISNRLGNEKERERQRWTERSERYYKEKHKDAGADLLEGLREVREAVQADRVRHAQEKQERKAAILALREDPLVEKLMELVPDLYDVKDYLCLVCKKPAIFSFHPFKQAAETGAIIPEELWDGLRADSSKMADKSRKYGARHVMIKERARAQLCSDPIAGQDCQRTLLSALP